MRALKVLIQRADRLGDALFSLPVIDQLKTLGYPVSIGYIASDAAYTLIAAHPHINHCYRYNHRAHKQLIKTICQDNYDVYLCLWNGSKALQYLGKQAGIPVCIGYHNQSAFTHSLSNSPDNLSCHMIEQNTGLLQPFGCDPVFKRAQLYAPKVTALPDLLRAFCDYQDGPKIALFTQTGGSNIPLPTTVVTGFIETLHHIEPATKIILLGHSHHPTQITMNNSLNTINSINAINQTSLPQLMHVIKAADYYIGPDTGPTHIASFYNIPSVFFSPLKINQPGTFGSLADRQVIIRQDTHYPKLRLTPSDYPQYLANLTGDTLYHAYQQLVNQPALSYRAIKQYHMMNTLRVLYFPYPQDTLFNQYAANYEQAGLPVFLAATSIANCITQLKQYNITILYGNVPKHYAVILRAYMGIVQAILKPVVLRYPLPNDPTSILAQYAKLFK